MNTGCTGYKYLRQSEDTEELAQYLALGRRNKEESRLSEVKVWKEDSDLDLRPTVGRIPSYRSSGSRHHNTYIKHSTASS